MRIVTVARVLDNSYKAVTYMKGRNTGMGLVATFNLNEGNTHLAM